MYMRVCVFLCAVDVHTHRNATFMQIPSRCNVCQEFVFFCLSKIITVLLCNLSPSRKMSLKIGQVSLLLVEIFPNKSGYLFIQERYSVSKQRLFDHHPSILFNPSTFNSIFSNFKNILLYHIALPV